MSSEQANARHAPTFQSGARDLIEADADKLSVIPDGWFYPRDDLTEEVYDATLSLLQRLADRGAIRTRTVTDSEGNSNDSKWNRHREYRLTDHTRELVDDVLENRDAMLPCGHSGLNNRGDHFECSFELCEKEFQREEIDA